MNVVLRFGPLDLVHSTMLQSAGFILIPHPKGPTYNVVVSKSELLSQRVGDAIDFLAVHSGVLKKIHEDYSNNMELDFGVDASTLSGVRNLRFHPDLLRLLGDLQIELCVSLHA